MPKLSKKVSGKMKNDRGFSCHREGVARGDLRISNDRTGVPLQKPAGDEAILPSKEELSNPPKVSAIVVNWNGMEFLPTCLDSLAKQSYKNLEIIVVDCASKDESVGFVKSNFHQVKLFSLKEDLGVPYALNLGCRHADGEYVLILNNDVYLPFDLVGKMVQEILKDKYSVINPVQFKADGSLLGAGYSIPLFGVHQLIKMKGEYPFYPCTACCLTTKEILMANPLNEKFFIYEDVEWGWRLKLKKVKCRVMTDGYFLHKDAGTVGSQSPRQIRYGAFSYLTTRYICFKNSTLLVLSPLLLLALLRYFLRNWFKGSKMVRSFWGGISDFFKKINEFSEYRRGIQKGRLVKSDIRILKEMIASHDFKRNFEINWWKHYKRDFEKRIKRDSETFMHSLRVGTTRKSKREEKECKIA